MIFAISAAVAVIYKRYEAIEKVLRAGLKRCAEGACKDEAANNN